MFISLGRRIVNLDQISDVTWQYIAEDDAHYRTGGRSRLHFFLGEEDVADYVCPGLEEASGYYNLLKKGLQLGLHYVDLNAGLPPESATQPPPAEQYRRIDLSPDGPLGIS